MQPQTPQTPQTPPPGQPPIPPTINPIPQTSNPITNPPQPTPQDNVTSQKRKRLPKWLVIVLIVVVVFAIAIISIFVFVMSSTNAPKRISDQFVNYVQAGDTQSAYLLTSESFQQATSQDELDQLLQRVGPLLQGEEKVTGRAIEKPAGSPTAAAVVYSIPTANGTKYIRVVLQEDASSWQVVNFQSADEPLEATIE